MPLITVKWVEGRSQQQRDALSRRIVEACQEVAQLPPSAVWIVFEDVKTGDWYTDGSSIAAQRAAAAAAAKPKTAAAKPAAAKKKAAPAKKAGAGKKAAKKK